MKNSSTYENRKEEIRKYIEVDDLSRATNRLMDFVSDFFPIDKSQKREATNNKAEWNNLKILIRQYPSSKELAERKQAFRMSILLFLDDLCEQLEERYKRITLSRETKSKGNLLKKSVSKERNTPQLTRYEREKEKYLRKIKKNQNFVVKGKNISKSYESSGGTFTLGPLNISLKFGEITSVVGENGSGKSTLLKLIARIALIDEGELKYPFFKSLGKSDPYEIIQQIAYIPQRIVYWPGSIIDALYYSASIHGVSVDNIKNEVDFIINRLDLAKYRDFNFGQLSVGYKMRFSLAKQLVWHPKLLVLDEPLANLDINAQELFLRDLRDLTNSITFPMTTIISSQHLHKMENITDNIIFLKEGNIIYNGSRFNLGVNHADNVYEIGCNLSKEELMDLLDEIDYLDVIDKEETFLIYTQKTVKSNVILKAFAEKKIKLNYFRDISNSSRRLFLNYND